MPLESDTMGKEHGRLSVVILYFFDVVDCNAGLYPSVIYCSIFALQLFIVISIYALRTFIYTVCGEDKGMRNGSRSCSCLAQERKGRPWGSCAKEAKSSGQTGPAEQADLRVMNTLSSRVGRPGEGVSFSSLGRSGRGQQASS